MKFISFFGYLFLLLIYGEQNCSGQTWSWGQQGYSSYGSDTYYSPVATDKEGNAYLTGAFNDTMVFNTAILKGAAGTGTNYANAFLVKVDSTGKLIWAREPITNSNTSIASESVTTDKNGNVFIAGYIKGIATFGNIPLGVFGGYSAFLVKYDSNGNVLWGKQSNPVEVADYANACSVATDDSGNAFINGLYSGGIIFGNDSLTAATAGSINVFLVKYDANGNMRWAKQSTNMGPEYYYTQPGSVTADIYGDAYITSYFIDSITFGSYVLHSPLGNPSAFLAKYSPQGTLLWARQSVNSKFNDTSQVFENSVTITDLGGNVYLTGGFEDSVAFDSYKLFSSGGNSIFLTKYDSGGKALWAEQSSRGWEGMGLAADDSNHIYLSGKFYLSGKLSYNQPYPDTLGFGSFKLGADKNQNAASFIIKFDTDGKADCGSILNHAAPGDVAGQYFLGVGAASDKTGTYIYTGTAFYGDTVVCGKDTLLYKGQPDNVLVARWKPCKNSSGISPPPPPPPPPTPTPPPPSPVEPSSCNIFVPDVFSPNGSVSNILYVRGDCIASMKFLVFDRWGNKIFESKNQSQGWDGSYGGTPMNTGTYIWYLKATTYGGADVEKKGNVTLVR